MRAPEYDAGEDVTDQLDVFRSCRRRLEAKRVNVGLLASMMQSLDRETHTRGITGQSLIKKGLTEK